MKMIHSRKFLILLFTLFSSSAMAMPKTVVLLRHAEKTKDESNVHLSKKGYERAAAMPLFLKKISADARTMKLFAQGLKHSDSSRRPIETLVPAAKTFGLEINQQFVKGESKELVKHLASSAALEKRTVVVSWGHDELHEIANRLGYAKAEEWNSKIFDRAWVLQFDARGKLMKFSDVPQKLLPGDSED